MEKNTMIDFLNSMISNVEQENIELYKEVIKSNKIEKFDNPEDFYFAVLYPWKNFIRGYLKTEINANRDIEFIYLNYGFIESHFNFLFQKIEGSACCADKSKTIIRRLVEFYTTNKRIEFNYDAEYTFHLPKKIFKTHDEIITFYESLKWLKTGNPERYLLALKNILPTEG